MSDRDHTPFLIVALALLSFGRIWWIRDGIWDDNTWLASIYSTGSLQEFLNAGFVELRRELLGIFFFYFLSLHKTTGYFYPLLHAINLLTQILCPLFLYYLVRDLFPDKPLLAAVTALCWVVFPLDHTLPYISSINYRLGMTLSLASLLCTERAVTAKQLRLPPLLLALLAAGFSQYVFLEPTIALEPGRALVVWMALSRRAPSQPIGVSAVALRMLPFVLLTTPVMLHKLLYKPFGLYEGIYPSDPLFFIHPKQMMESLQAILSFERRELGRAFKLDNFWAIVLGAVAATLSFAALRTPSPPASGGSRDREMSMNRWERVTGFFRECCSAPLILGTVFFVFPASLFFYAHLPFVGEQHNTHAALLQVGFALLAGSAMWLGCHLAVLRTTPAVVSLALALLFGSGVCFNNKYLDLYFDSWREQSVFLNSFLARFPSLPDRAVLFLDVRDNAIFSDLRNPIDFEFPINLLYATSTDPKQFRRFLVSTPDEYRSSHSTPDTWNTPGDILIDRRTRWGTEILKTEHVIVIQYRDGRLLVSREILLREPDIHYSTWLKDDDFPSLPLPSRYVLRKKVEGLSIPPE